MSKTGKWDAILHNPTPFNMAAASPGHDYATVFGPPRLMAPWFNVRRPNDKSTREVEACFGSSSSCS